MREREREREREETEREGGDREELAERQAMRERWLERREDGAEGTSHPKAGCGHRSGLVQPAVVRVQQRRSAEIVRHGGGRRSAKLVDPHTRDMSDLTGLSQEICDLTGLSAEVVGHDDIVSAEADGTISERLATVPTCLSPPSTETMICRSALARTPSSTASVAADRCRRTRSARSARGASRCQ